MWSDSDSTEDEEERSTHMRAPLCGNIRTGVAHSRTRDDQRGCCLDYRKPLALAAIVVFYNFSERTIADILYFLAALDREGMLTQLNAQLFWTIPVYPSTYLSIGNILLLDMDRQSATM